MGLVPFTKEAPESSPRFPACGDTARDGHLRTWKQALTRHQICQHLHQRTVRKQYYLSYPGYGILLWQPQWTKTACKRTMHK